MAVSEPQLILSREWDLELMRCAERVDLKGYLEVIARDYEGLVAKEETSLYEAGPTRRWLKVKQKGWTVEEDRWQRRFSTTRNI